MFDMSNDSRLFRTRDALLKEGDVLSGNVFSGHQDYLPLYEAKMIAQYDHRFAQLLGEGNGDGRLSRKYKGWYGVLPEDPNELPNPQYWVPRTEVEARLAGRWDRKWLLGFRDIARSHDERTAIFSLIPRVGVGHKAPLLLPSAASVQEIACLFANLNALVFDYCVRSKVGGSSLGFFILKQLPVLPRDRYTSADLEYLVPRVLELAYTAWDMQPFARDLGCEGPPFAWDGARRALLRAELDAYYARLYGLTRKQLRYILDPHSLTDRELSDILDPIEDPPDAPRTRDFPGETFRVLKGRELREYGEYRTGRLVLGAWDALG